jgi:hypothetical protein
MTVHGVHDMQWSRDFALVDASTLLDPAIAKIKHSTAAAVVLAFAGAFYVFRRDEILRHRRVRRYRLLLGVPRRTLADVLELRATEASRVTRDASTPAEDSGGTDPSGESARLRETGRSMAGNRLCVARTVLINAAGEPVAVAGPGVGDRSARRAAAVPPPSPAPRAPSPTLGGSPAEEEEMTSGSEPPDETGASPGDAGEAKSAMRYPSIEPDAAPRPGKPIALTVDLTRQRSASTSGGEMAFEAPDEDWTELGVDVHLVCPAIEFANATGRIVVRCNAASKPAVIHGTVRADQRVGAAIDVSAIFMHAGRFSGNALRTLTVQHGDADARSTGERAAEPPTSGRRPPDDAADDGTEVGPPSAGGGNGSTVGNLLVEVGAESPDLTVHILIADKSEPGKLLWLVEPRDLFDELPAALRGTCDIGRNAESFMTNLFREYAELERGKHQRRLEGFGESLWEKVPDCFRDTYWAMWDRYRRPLTIQFVSDEPNLPWELMRPSRPGEQHPLLAGKHPVARWIASYGSYLRNRLPAGGLCTIGPRYASASTRLQRAEAEALRLVEQLGARRIDGKYETVLALLEASALPTSVSLLHFAGHGKFAAGAADASTIKLEDGSLAVSEVAREAVQLGVRCRTVVFFNACEVGATGAALGAVGGWADAFLKRRFGGFIAPLWAVDDEDAGVVSAELLAGIVTERRPVGAVLQGIREKYGDVSPTFLSYLYYGDVTACIGGAVTT